MEGEVKVPFSWGAVASPPAPDLADVMSEELQLQSEQLATQLQSKEFGMLQDVLPKEVILAHALKKSHSKNKISWVKVHEAEAVKPRVPAVPEDLDTSDDLLIAQV